MSLYSFSSVQSLSQVQLFVTPWTAGRQASLSITNSQSLLKLMSIESVTPSNHLISSKEQASFYVMVAVPICSDFGAQENKVCHCFRCFPICLL